MRPSTSVGSRIDHSERGSTFRNSAVTYTGTGWNHTSGILPGH